MFWTSENTNYIQQVHYITSDAREPTPAAWTFSPTIALDGNAGNRTSVQSVNHQLMGARGATEKKGKIKTLALQWDNRSSRLLVNIYFFPPSIRPVRATRGISHLKCDVQSPLTKQKYGGYLRWRLSERPILTKQQERSCRSHPSK